jgi:hypothetical protein
MIVVQWCSQWQGIKFRVHRSARFEFRFEYLQGFHPECPNQANAGRFKGSPDVLQVCRCDMLPDPPDRQMG